ncbi:C-C motif chemokine 5-like [Toxotes jaculatrix]|uniref:C-C motif chemokine 5-like n=1 Tax=Toxotes jaculatrix TaxID=941984 RepID=UPI001B3AEBE9|nr:C-C motif chemokine 5-like [Toxotes jaculatrix]
MMMMMKNPIVLVACMLLLSSLTVMASQSVFGPDECCFNFISHPLPKKRVVSYKYTDKLCPMEGVLFTMLNRAKLCANPSTEWVKNIIKIKDEAQARNASLHS